MCIRDRYSLTLAINIYIETGSVWPYQLGKALARSTSLNSLTLAINNYSDSDSDSLSELEKIKSLTEYNFTFNIYGKWKPQPFVKIVEKGQVEDAETEGQRSTSQQQQLLAVNTTSITLAH